MIEKYDLLEKISDGSFGTLYKAKLKSTGEFRAIKIINKKKLEKIGNDNNFMKTLLINGAENMKICCQNNINSVKLYENFETENEIYYVMELMDENLEQFLQKRNQGLNPQEVLEILRQLNRTFKIMVDNLIVHRDIKLGTIFIKYKNNEKTEYEIKLGGYDASVRFNSSEEKLDLMVGTNHYIVPEILKQKKYDAKCDLWSLGLSIYFLLFREFPIITLAFGDKNIEKELISLKASGNELLDDLIKKLLEKDPGKRLTWEQYFDHPFFK